MNRPTPLLTIALVLCLLLVSCGGGGGSSSYKAPTTPSTPAGPPVLALSTTPLPDVVVGQTYSVQIQASGGTAPYTWSSGTGFPAWLTLDGKSGAIAGTVPSSAGSYSLPVTVTDSATPPQTAQRTYIVGVYAKIALAYSPPSANRGIPYSWYSTMNGGRYPYTMSVESGLPAGMQIVQQSSGSSWFTLQGTPTEAGAKTVNIRVKDSESPPQETVVPMNITVDSKLAVATEKLKTGVVGRSYSDAIAAVNGIPPLRWSVTGYPGLPSGLSLNSATGELSGIPTAYAYGFGVTVSDSAPEPQTATAYVNIQIYEAMKFTLASTREWHIGDYLSESLYWGGIPPLTSSIVSGALPPDLSISNNQMFGKLSQRGTFLFTLRVQDSDNPPYSIENTFSITVLPPLPVLSDSPLPSGAVNKAYAAQLYARDGTLPYHWSVSSGNLPAGLSIDSSGAITGTPTKDGNYSFMAAVTDSATPPQTGTRYYSIAIARQALGRNDSIATATPVSYPGITASLSPFADPADSAASAPDTDYYRLIAGAGVKVNLSVGRSYAIDPVIEILDANGQRYKTCRDQGDDKPTLPFLVKDATPDAYDDECLNDDVDPTVDLTARLEFFVPGATGTHLTFYVHVFDSRGDARPDMTYHLDAYGIESPLRIPSTSLPGASVGLAYQGPLSSAGGIYPVKWELAPGSDPLPPGLSISSGAYSSSLTGTPSAKGTYTFSLRVSDSANPSQVVTGTFQLTVYDPLVIVADKFPDIKVGQPYSFTALTSGGIPPLTWSFYSDFWCCIQLNQTTGEWSGTGSSFLVGNTFTGRVGVADATGRTASKTMTLTVVP